MPTFARLVRYASPPARCTASWKIAMAESYA